MSFVADGTEGIVTQKILKDLGWDIYSGHSHVIFTLPGRRLPFLQVPLMVLGFLSQQLPGCAVNGGEINLGACTYWRRQIPIDSSSSSFVGAFCFSRVASAYKGSTCAL
jgi:hypothetical protein